MIEFERHSDCTDCPLYESAKNPGLPSRAIWDDYYGARSCYGERAILFVGQSPGYWEDKGTKGYSTGRIFIGYTGQLLEKLVGAARLTEYADIYFSNAIRCRPPQGANETQSQIRACRKHLRQDIEELRKYYKEIIIFNLGAKACYSTLNISSLTESLKCQGQESKIFEGIRVFSTNHPAMLHPTRSPAKINAVEAHFNLLLRYLKGNFIPNSLVIDPELGIDVPDICPPAISCDIETYGIISGQEQTVFHPVKSAEVDGIPYKHQIETVSFSWYEGTKRRDACYIWNWKRHRRIIRKWFKLMVEKKITCVGQNIKFDLLYLKMAGDRELNYWIDPRRLQVDDVMLVAFLYYEQQPEKGLKEQALLYGIADYSKDEVTGKSGNAKSRRDKNLHYYNCKDTAVTLCLYNDYLIMIKDKYGADTPKLSDISKWMRNTIIWDALYLEMVGSGFNIPKLQKYHDEELSRCQELLKLGEEKYEIKFAGKRSDKHLRQLMLDCLTEADLIGDHRVMWTGKEKKISIGVENVNLAKEFLPTVSRNYDILSSFQEYKERSKTVSTYTKPILEDKRRGIVRVLGRVGLVFPSWYPVPIYNERGGRSDDKAGGQIQGRFSCKKPARQTEPKAIQQCSASRFPDGKIIEYDIASDHLRMAALLSGDPLLMEAFTTEGRSLHLMTAETLFPEEFHSSKNFKEEHLRKYKVSKNLNFLVLFKGGATAFQSEAREKAATELDIGFCQDAINKWYKKHYVYKKWQDDLITLAAKQGYLVLPTGWSRTFGLGMENIASQQGEVCNFMHQCPCAQVMHSIQWKIMLRFLKYNLHSLVCHEKHDALFIDTHPAEVQVTHEIIDDAMTHPPLLPVFERWTGRQVPWAYERTVYEE